MAKTKKITVKEFEDIARKNYVATEVVEWNGVDIIINRTLSLRDMLEFVDMVVNSCFSEQTGSYLPEIRSFAISMCILEKYANFSMPSDIEKQYELIYRTDAVKAVVERINRSQLDDIITAIDQKIDNIASANIDAVHSKMSDLCVAFENMQNQMSTLFSGINEEDIKNMTAAMSGGLLDQDKLVKAYIDNTKNVSGE